jgi:chromosome segregation ATPase
MQLNDVRIRKISGSSSSSYNLASPSSQRSSRRRSTSLSSDTRVQDLEAELSLLRQTAGSNEVESIKTQLATVKRELDKAINEKIAIESKARKEVESIRNQLYDANFELDGIRRDMEDGGSVSKQDLEKRQKAWEGEKAELAATVKDLERVVADGKLELGELRDAADEVQRLRQELDSERSKQVIVAPIAVDHTEELARLTGEVTSLQAELARAKASTPPSSAVANTSSADLTIRRLERKLDKAQRDAEALEESLNQAEEENQALRSRVPLPGSPGKKVDDGRVMELEVDNENLQAEVSQLRNQVQSLRDDLEILQAAHARAEQAEQALQTAQGDIGSEEVAWRAERKVSLRFSFVQRFVDEIRSLTNRPRLCARASPKRKNLFWPRLPRSSRRRRCSLPFLPIKPPAPAGSRISRNNSSRR